MRDEIFHPIKSVRFASAISIATADTSSSCSDDKAFGVARIGIPLLGGLCTEAHDLTRPVCCSANGLVCGQRQSVDCYKRNSHAARHSQAILLDTVASHSCKGKLFFFTFQPDQL